MSVNEQPPAETSDTCGAFPRLGDAYDAAGNSGAAHTAWHRALSILNQLHHPDAEQVRTKLHDLD